jgi:hypothetical protein
MIRLDMVWRKDATLPVLRAFLAEVRRMCARGIRPDAQKAWGRIEAGMVIGAVAAVTTALRTRKGCGNHGRRSRRKSLLQGRLAAHRFLGDRGARP